MTDEYFNSKEFKHILAEYEESEEAQKLATLKNGNIERLKLAVFTVKAHMGVDIDKIPSQ